MSSYWSLPEFTSSIGATLIKLIISCSARWILAPLPRDPAWHPGCERVDNPGFKGWLPLYHDVTLACKVQGKAIVSWVYFYCTKQLMGLNYFFHLPTILTNWSLGSQESRFPNVNQTLEFGVSRNVEKSWGIFGSEVWFSSPQSDQDSGETQTLSYIHIFWGVPLASQIFQALKLPITKKN